ncbi:hypothetical protein [Pseudomonas sp. LRF_L74]|uniref:hypothetical protein n=1 Tax=Pseudomonas sp. LRF_L74 TaxID=3369422 RepID=UPI003F619926
MSLYKSIVNSLVDQSHVSYKWAPLKIAFLVFMCWLLTNYILLPYTKNLIFLQDIDRAALLVPSDFNMMLFLPAIAAASMVYAGSAILHFLAYFRISYYSKRKSALVLALAVFLGIVFFTLSLNAKLSVQTALKNGKYFSCPYSYHPLFEGLDLGGKRIYPNILLSNKASTSCP